MARFSSGWIKVDRQLAEEDIAQRGTFTLGTWVRLLLYANWKEGSVYHAGKQVRLAPGQLVTGLRNLSPDEDEDPYLHRIRGALAYLQQTGRIQQSISKQGRVITVINWASYQLNSDDAHTNAQTDRKRGANEAQCSKEEKKEEVIHTSSGDDDLPTLAKIWNQHRGDLPRVRECNSKRKKAVSLRWKEKPDPEYWAAVVSRLAASKFCRGETKGNTWRASFDFLLQPGTRIKALEGQYDDPKGNGAAQINTTPVNVFEGNA